MGMNESINIEFSYSRVSKSYVEVQSYHPRAKAMRFRTSVVTTSVMRGNAFGLMMRRA